jgi:hypothetical protein
MRLSQDVILQDEHSDEGRFHDTSMTGTNVRVHYMFNVTLSLNAYVNTGTVLCFLLVRPIIYQYFFAFTMNRRQSEHDANMSLKKRARDNNYILFFLPSDSI